MKLFLIILFIIFLFVFMFCIWVFAKTSGRANDMEEQMEIERKLKKGNKNE